MAADVLTINGGSSSIKFALFAPGDGLVRMLSGTVDRIGLSDAVLSAKEGNEQPIREPSAARNHEEAAAHLIDWLGKRGRLTNLAGVGHRVVHGGSRYTRAQLVTPEMVAELKRLSPVDPAHLPGEIALIEALVRRLRHVPQVACFDTAFHHDLPSVARILPIPRRFEAAGVRRYGFHGLSYSFLLEELARIAGPEAAHGRVILAHLGAGASLAAVHNGKSIDTTMAFTPTAGLVMATRSGDLDPGLLVYLMRSENLNADQIDDLVNRQSGLLGVSEISPDMRDLLAAEATNSRAVDAVAIFCYQAKKWIGAFAAALGGLDTLVFAGGIGEHAPEVRARICKDLGFLGIHLEQSRNNANASVISIDGSPATVRVIRTDEEGIIAKEVQRVVSRST